MAKIESTAAVGTNAATQGDNHTNPVAPNDPDLKSLNQPTESTVSTADVSADSKYAFFKQMKASVPTYDAASQTDKNGNNIKIKDVKDNVRKTTRDLGFDAGAANRRVVDVMVENPSGRGNDDPPGGKFEDGTPKKGTPSEECGPFNIGVRTYKLMAERVGMPWNENLAKDTGQAGLEYGIKVLSKHEQQFGPTKTQVFLRGGEQGMKDYNAGFKNGDSKDVKNFLEFKSELFSAYKQSPGLSHGTLRHANSIKHV